MVDATGQRRGRRAAVGRRRAAAAAILIAVVVAIPAAIAASSSPSRRPSSTSRPSVPSARPPAARVRRPTPPRSAINRGGRHSAGGAARRASAAPPLPKSMRIPAPVVAQRLRNNCETAALQVLLATVGVKVDQLRLQAKVRRSGPLDPQGSPPNQTWGDPSLGFVGRVAGGGRAGGFGVYQGPIAALAQRFGVPLRDLTGSSPRAVYRRLLEGHAVMAWVGLSNGPFAHWRSPSERTITVNFGEHAVVLVGMRASGVLEVVNPLYGTRELWTRADFRTMWARLGRRALST
jgi:uncharacterized protein YvpB